MMRRFAPILLLAMLPACGDGGGNEAFRTSGELIAFSGGDGGAQHACATCHGLKGEGDGRLTPRLAGLDPGYMHRQLDDYATGRRQHPEMRAIVRRLSAEDRAKVSAYYAALPPTETTLPRTSSLYRTKCAQCHGDQGQGMGPANPPLAGQPSAYIEAQLDAWRSGKRRGDPLGEMLAISRALSPAEVRILADHAEVPSPLPHPPPVSEASR